MTSNRFSPEVQEAINRLRAGGRLFIIEEKPYPFPHRIVVVTEIERYIISYNSFVFLMTHQIIRLVGPNNLDGFPAEEYVLSPDLQN